jgi:hypothetical protein
MTMVDDDLRTLTECGKKALASVQLHVGIAAAHAMAEHLRILDDRQAIPPKFPAFPPPTVLWFDWDLVRPRLPFVP